MRLDWRRILIYTHRWLGIAGSAVFFVWFVSGLVMMYARMPRLTAEERLARLRPVDLSRLHVKPADAARSADVSPERFRVGMLADRPVYRFFSQGRWTTAFADTGEPLRGLSDREALDIVRRFLPAATATARYAGYVTSPDQWLLDGGLPRLLPMHRIAIGDAADTFLYVSERSGEPVMKTTARGRFWGYLGAILHWTYFTPFRRHQGLWRYSIVCAALIGCVMCLSGLAVGVWRYSLSGRYRLKRVRSHSPYAGFMWWHHYAGLLFGLFTFTWALSGALSLTPWDWAPSTAPLAAQADAVAGGPLRIDDISVGQIRAAAAVISQSFAPKELEILQWAGKPFLMAYRAPRPTDAAQWTNPDLRAIQSPQLAIDHRLVWLDAPERGSFARFDDDAVLEAAHIALPDAPMTDHSWLYEYDGYYYDRWAAKPLPVLRVRYADAPQTWLYLDPQNGLISLRYQRLSRINRWLYNGLHSFDFPIFYYTRPLWDLVLIGLSAGGTALAVTTMWPAWRRLRRHVRRWSAM